MSHTSVTRLLPLLLFGAIVTAPVSSSAGGIDQGLADVLSETPSHGYVTGLVSLSEQVDIPAIRSDLTSRNITSRWRRHQTVVQHAQELAARSQTDLLNRLEAIRQTGSVRSYRSFWVTNMIEVEARPAVFDELAAREDVGTIYHNGQIQPRFAPEVSSTRLPSDRDLPNNLVCINLQPAWDQGFRGQGRIVAVFDSGADGNHPAYSNRWRGALEGVEWWEAWKDPYTDTTFPYDSRSHGTHVLGVAVGEMPGEYPLGVAPDALWIAAGAVIGYNVDKVIECFEWAIDPDGDPSTIDDVPDVINNSWGTTSDCDMTYWNAIDLVEAAGIVNIIAVDNSGPDPGSVNSPESRADTPNVNWGVGNVDPHQPEFPIANNSGRGPSPCDMESIKPEVTAPGVEIFSTLPNYDYGFKSGTSIACPHAAGAIAILRQVNPELTVDEIKGILMATSLDRGDAGEDNDYGWGVIDIGAAVDSALHTVPPFPPENLFAAATDSSVALEWEQPERILPGNPLQGYHIYRAPFGEQYPEDPIVYVSGLTFPLEYVDGDVPHGAYHYVATAVYQSGESGPSNEVEAFVIPETSVGEFALGAGRSLSVSPNPFNPVTVVKCVTSSKSPVTITIHDGAGSLVKTLIKSTTLVNGEQSILWDGTDNLGHHVASGSYFLRLEQDGAVSSRRVTLLK